MRAFPSSHSSSERLSGDAGAAMVEFALIAPVLLLLIFGIYEFSLAYNAKVEITGAAREGARALALGKSTSAVEQAVHHASPGISPAPSVTVIQACPADPNDEGDAEVKVNYTFAYSIPFFGEGTWPIEAKGVMRCGL